MRYVIAVMALFIIVMVQCSGIADARSARYAQGMHGWSQKQYVETVQASGFGKVGLAHKYDKILKLSFEER